MVNALELRVVWLGLRSFCNDLKNVDIKVESDNTTTIAHINNQGGTCNEECNKQTRLIWEWCKAREIWLVATHLPGKLNETADFESQNFTENTEWQLNLEIFKILCERWGSPDMDLFASRLNNQVPCYASWGPDPLCSFVNAFTCDWGNSNSVIYFPVSGCSPRCVQKLKEEWRRAVVVCPNWPGQPWWSTIRKKAGTR